MLSILNFMEAAVNDNYRECGESEEVCGIYRETGAP
jgi:hypothetical protein